MILVGLGGAVGSMLRFLLHRTSMMLWGPAYPWGTFLANLGGCFVMGLAAALIMARLGGDPIFRHLVMIGFLGGLTTFSTFAFDFSTLWERAPIPAIAYLTTSVAGSIAGFIVGFRLGQNLAGS